MCGTAPSVCRSCSSLDHYSSPASSPESQNTKKIIKIELTSSNSKYIFVKNYCSFPSFFYLLISNRYKIKHKCRENIQVTYSLRSDIRILRSSTFHGQLVYTNQPSNFTDSSPRHLQNNKALSCKRERCRHKALTYLKVSICVWEAMGKVDCVMVMLQLHSPSQRIERLVRFRGRIPVQKITQTFQLVYSHCNAF